MARIKPDEPGPEVGEALADVIERRRNWPTSVEVFAAIADEVDNNGRSVQWAAEQLGLRRAQVYRDYWTPFRARYEAGATIEELAAELAAAS
jgi:hypothetical protein